MKTLARQRDRDDVLRRLRELRPDSERRWGKMSAHQMVCHLADAFRMGIGRRKASPATGPLQRTMVKWIALYLPMRWPVGIMTRPEIDPLAEGTSPVNFAADVAEVASLIELITTEPRRVEWQPHPVFGRMSESAWLRWAYLHMDHHLRQFGV